MPLEIHDQARPANSGHWQLTVADGTGALTPNGGVPSPATAHPGPPRRGGPLRGHSRSPRCAWQAWPSGGTPEADAALDAAFAATPYMLDDF